MTKKRTVLVAIAVLTFLVGGVWYDQSNLFGPESSVDGRQGEKASFPNADKRGTQSIDFSDDRVLLGQSHFVFVGRVLRQVGSEIPAWATSPNVAQFSTEVVYNIKGDLRGTVVISQFAGRQDLLVQPGSTYVFASRYYPEKGWYLFAPKEDYVLMTDNESLDLQKLSSIAQANERVLALKRAYPNEILNRADVAEHTAYNSYESLKSGHLFTPPPFVPETTNAPATESAASFTSPELTPSASETISPSVSAEPAPWPTITHPAESTAPSPTEVPVES